MDEPCEAVWQSALGCLLHLTTQGGHWVASICSQLPPAAAAALLDACVTFHWSQELHARLVQMAVNLLYLSDHSSGQQHGVVHAHSFGAHTQQRRQREHEQEQEQQKEGLKAGDDDAAAAAALASPEDVSVTLDTLGGSKGGKQQQQQRQEEVDAAEPAQHDDDWQEGEAGGPAQAGVDSGGAADDDARSTGQHSSKWGARGSQLGDLDLPWQLHAGPVDEQQLTAFGGPAKLLQHLCQAGSVEAQRTLLVPLLQVLMPPDVPDKAQLAILQALCARPSCLAALQAAVSAGLPGWSGCVVLAVQQQLGSEGLDVSLLSCLLLRLEQLSMQRMGALAGSAAASLGSAGGGGSSSGSSAGRQQQQDEPQPQQQQQAPLPQLPAEVQLAMQVTLQQLRGKLPSRPQAHPSLQAADTTVYQVRAVLRVLSQQGRLHVARHAT